MTILVAPIQLAAVFAAAILVSICLTSASKGQAPVNAPAAKPLLEIVEQLEQEGYGPFSEISKDDGYWEIEVSRDGVAYELTVSPETGKVVAQHRDDPERLPPKEAMPLSKLLKSILKDTNYRSIDEVSFERRYWEIEVFQSNEKHEIHVDPVTAKVIADRVDD
jgi:uncharacterized membrane protein YkoI